MVGQGQADVASVELSELVQCLATQALDRGQQNPRVGRVTIRSRDVQRSPPPQIEQTAFGLMHMTVQRYERYEGHAVSSLLDEQTAWNLIRAVPAALAGQGLCPRPT